MTFVALGDSTTAGTPEFRSPAEFAPDGIGNPESQYAFWIMKLHPEWKVINRGVAGERTDQILKRFVSDVLPFNPDGVIILAGVNDLYQLYPASVVIKNLEALYQRAQAANLKVLVCTVLPYNEASPKIRAAMSEVNVWIEAYARKNNLGFCDTYRAVEDPNRPGFLLGSADGIHPDIATYRKMGEAIAKALETL
jgi:lysophospholipase L1-like esterase